MTASTTPSPISTPSATATPAVAPPLTCELYPIALHTRTLAGVTPATTIANILNGTQVGNFGWLVWVGAPSERSLAISLTPPGDSATYLNPFDPADHVLAADDWVRGNTWVTNSTTIRNALDRLKTVDTTVPVWDSVQSLGGSVTVFHIVSFAQVRLVSYQLPGQNRISVVFIGFTGCGM